MPNQIPSIPYQLSSGTHLLTSVIIGIILILLGGKKAFALINAASPKAPSFELSARGYITEPFSEINTVSKVRCAARCHAMNYLCYGFSLTALPGVSTLLCRISVGNPAWVEDRNSSLFLLSDKLKAAKAGNYSLRRDGRLYKRFSDQKTLVNSIQACVDDEATLAPAYTTEQTAILAHFFLPGTPLALGMFLEDSSSAKWRTFNGEIFYSSNATNDPLQKWVQQPTTATDCAGTTSASLSEWIPKACFLDTTLYARVCRRDLGYHERPNKKIHKLRKNCPTQFSAAQALCAAEGGNLASLYTEEDFEAAADIRIQLRTFQYNRAFVGGTDAMTEGIWIMPNAGLNTTSMQEQLGNWQTGGLGNHTTEAVKIAWRWN